jgi:hypothetical protein
MSVMLNHCSTWNTLSSCTWGPTRQILATVVSNVQRTGNAARAQQFERQDRHYRSYDV